MTQIVSRRMLRRRLCRSTTLGTGALLFAHAAIAQTLPAGTLPTGESVSAGAPTFTRTPAADPMATPPVVPNRLDVGLNDTKTIIGWDTFNVSSEATVNFANNVALTPPVAVLNRVNAANGKSIIDGQLTSDASVSVYLVNGAGILFSRGAQVNVGSLIASTEAIDDNFTVTSAKFTAGSDANRSIEVNAGATLRASGLGSLGQGNLVLIGAKVAVTAPASGSADAPALFETGNLLNDAGNVALVAAEDLTLTVNPGGPLGITITKGTAVAGAFQVAGTLRGRNVTLALATRGGVTESLLSAGSVATATGAAVTDMGVVLAAGATVSDAGAVVAPGADRPGVTYTVGVDLDAAGGITAGAITSAATITIAAAGDVTTSALLDTGATSLAVLRDIGITAGGVATAADAITSGGNYAVRGASIVVGATGTNPVQRAVGKVDLTATTGGISALGTPTITSNSGAAAYDGLINRSIFLDALNGAIDLTGATLNAANYAVQIRNNGADQTVARGVILGDVTAYALTVANAAHDVSRTTTTSFTSALTLGNVSLSAADLSIAGTATIASLGTAGAASVTATGAGSDAAIGGLGTTSGNATVTAAGKASVTGGATIGGDYAVTGASVVLGRDAAVTQTATGAVTITATGGTLTSAPGTSAALTLRSDSGGAGGNPLTLDAQDVALGTIAVGSATLQGGSASQSLVRIRSATAANLVTLGTVTALGLQGAVGTDAFATGLIRDSALTVGDVTLAQPLILQSRLGALTGRALSGTTVSLRSNGLLSATSATATTGGLTIAGTGDATITGALTAANATAGDVTIDRNGAVSFGSLTAGRDVLIGQTTPPSTLTVSGISSGRDLLIATLGDLAFTGTTNVTRNVSLTSAGTVSAGTLLAGGTATLNGLRVSADAVRGTTVGITAGTSGAALTALTSTSGAVAVSSTGAVGVAGAVDAATSYAVTGSSVTLGSTSVATVQQAVTTVAIEASGGTLTGLSGLTLRSDKNGAGASPLTLTTSGGSGGIAFGGTTLEGGSARQSLVRIRSATAAAGVTLGNVTALGLQGALGTDPFVLGLTQSGMTPRTGPITVNDVTLTQALLLDTLAPITAGALSASAIALNSAGAMQLVSAQAATGAIAITGSGTLTVTGAAGIAQDAGASGNVSIDRTGAISLTQTRAANDLLIGQTTPSTSVGASGTTSAGHDLLITAGLDGLTLADLSAGTDAALTPSGSATLSSTGATSIIGDADVRGAYGVTGASVVLGPGSATRTQKAGGTVSITATGGGITGQSGLTLQSNADGAGDESLVLATTGASGGDIRFAGTTLLGGTAPQPADFPYASLVQVRSGLGSNIVVLGDVKARGLEGAVGGAAFTPGLTRSAAITVGNVDLAEMLALTSGGDLVGGNLSASSVALSANGALTATSITARSGAIALAGSGPLGVAGAITNAAATASDITVTRSGALMIGSIDAGRDLLIGQGAPATRPTTVNVIGTVNARRDIAITSTGDQTYTDAITSTRNTTLASGGTLTLATLAANGAATLSSPGLMTLGSVSAAGGAVTIAGAGDLTVTGANGLSTTGAGDVRIDRGGAVTLTKVSAARNLLIGQTVPGTTVSVSGTLDATGDIRITSGSDQSYAGAITSTGNTMLASGGTLTLATLTANGAATLSSPGLMTLGAVSAAGGAVTIAGAGDLIVTGANGLSTTSASAGNIVIDRGGAIALTRTNAALDLLIGQTLRGTTINASDIVNAGRDIRIASNGNQSYAGAITSTGNTMLASGGTLTLATLAASGAATLSSPGLMTLGSVSAAGGAVTIGGAGDLTVTGANGLSATSTSAGDVVVNRGGAIALTQIRAGRDVLIGQAAPGTTLSASGTLAAGRALAVRAMNAITLPAAVSAGTSATLRGGSIQADSVSATTGTASLTATSGIVDVRTLSAGADAAVDASGAATVREAVQAGGDYSVIGSAVTLGSGAVPVVPVLQAANRSVLVTSRTGAITGLAGLTVRADGAGTGAGTLVLDGAGGIAFDPASTVQGGAGASGEIGLRAGAGAPVSLGVVTALRLTGADAGHAPTPTLLLSGPVTLGGTVTVTNTLDLTTTGSIVANRVTVTGAGQNLSLTANGASADLTANDRLDAPGAITLRAGRNMAFTVAAAGGNATLTAGGTIGGTTLRAGSSGRASASAGGALTLTSITGGAGVFARGTAVTLGSADAASGLVDLAATAGDLVVPTVMSGGGVVLAASGDVAVDSATAGSGADLAITSATGVHGTIGGTRAALAAGRNLTIAATGDVLLGTASAAQGAITVGGGSIDVTQATATLGAASFTAASGDALIGTLTSGGDSAVTANAGGVRIASLQAGGNATLRGATVSLDYGRAAGSAQLTSLAGGIAAPDLAAGAVSITAATQAVLGTIRSTAGTLIATAGGALTATTLAAQGNATIGAASIDVETASSAAGALALSTSTGLLRIGEASAAGNVTLASAGDTEIDRATAGGGGDLLVTTVGLRGRAGGTRAALSAGRNVTLQASGVALAGPVTAGGIAQLGGATLDVSTITAASAIVTAAAGDLTVGTLTTTGAATLTATAGTATLGTIDATGALAIDAGAIEANDVRSRAGTVQARTRTGDLHVATLTAAGDATILSAGAARLDRATSSGGAIAVDAAGAIVLPLASAATTLRATGASVEAGSATAAAIALTAQSGALTVGSATAGQQLSLTKIGTTGAIAASGPLQAGSDALISSSTDATLASVQAGRDITIGATGAIVAPSLVAGRALSANAGDDATLAAVTAGGAASVVAGGMARVTGVVAAGSYAVQGNAVTLGTSGVATRQSATGLVAIRATGGAVEGVAGLTLVSDADGDGAGDLVLRGAGGIAFATGTSVLGGGDRTAAVRLEGGAGAPIAFDQLAARTLASYTPALDATSFAGSGPLAVATLSLRDATTVQLTGAGSAVTLGIVTAGKAFTLSTQGSLGATSVTVGGALSLAGARATIGTIQGGGAATVVATAGALQLASIDALGPIALSATGDVRLGTATARGGALAITAADGALTALDATSGTVLAAQGASGDIGVVTGGAAVIATATAGRALSVRAGDAGVATRDGRIAIGQATAGGALTLVAFNDLAGSPAGIALGRATAGSATIQALGTQGAVVVGPLQAATSIVFGGTRDVALADPVAAGTSLAVAIDGALTAANLSAGTTLDIAAGQANVALARSAADMAIRAGAIDAGDVASSGGALTLASTGGLRLATGSARGAASVTSSGAATIGTLASTAGNVAVTSGGALQAMRLTAAGAIDARGPSVTIGSAGAGTTLSLTATAGDVSLTDGSAGSDATLAASGTATATRIAAGRATTVTGTTLALGTVTSGGPLTATAGSGGARLDAAIVQSGASLRSAASLLIGTLAATGDLAATADGQLGATSLTAGGATTLGARGVTLGQVRTTGALAVTTGADLLSIDQGASGPVRLTAGGDLRIGTLAATGDGIVTVAGASTIGTFTATGALSATGPGQIAATTLRSGTTLVASGASLALGSVGSGAAATLTATAGGLTLTTLATGGTATLTASGDAMIAGPATVGGDYLVRATNIVLGNAGGGASAQTVAGRVSAIASTGSIRGLAGLALASGTGGASLTATGAGGTIDLAAASSLDGRGLGDVALETAGLASLGTIAGGSRAVTVSAADIALNAPVSSASVTFTNRTPANVTRLGDAPTAAAAEFGGGSTRFDLSTAELARVTAANFVVDAQSGAVRVGDLALASGAGSTSLQLRTSNRLDVLGRLTAAGSPPSRAIILGGGAGEGDRARSIRVASTSAGGGRIVVDGATIDLRADSIGVGFDTGFLTTIGLTGDTPVSATVAATSYVPQPDSALYNASLTNPLGIYADPVTIQAGRLVVRYANFALFQNTGRPGTSTGVVLGGAGSEATSQTVQLLAASSNNAFALFGTINGIGGTATSLLGNNILTIGGQVSRANSRANGCLIGAAGGGCLSASLVQPTLNVFDASRAEVFRTADDLTLPFDPLVGTSNEALFSDIASSVVTDEDGCLADGKTSCPQSGPTR